MPMTWRKLFLTLLAVTTVMMAATWIISLRYQLEIEIHAPRTSVCGRLKQGKIAFEVLHPNIRPMANWDLDVKVLPSFVGGAVRRSWIPGSHEFPRFRHPGPPLTLHYLVVPMWFPWLLLTAGALAFCRMKEKRSVRSREKELAEKGAAAE